MYAQGKARPPDGTTTARLPAVGTPGLLRALPYPSGALPWVNMTGLQQAIAHGVNVVVAVVAFVVLAVTGNLSTEVVTVVLAVTGFGAVGIAGVTQTDAVPSIPVATTGTKSTGPPSS
jgi:hypothetical protein